MNATGDGPLAGLEVVEVCSAIAGPYAGKLLADCGATVTKVEPLSGSTYRNRPLGYDRHGSDGFVYRFMSYNTGKDSIALDLKSDEGAAVLWDLLAEADVLLENMRPGVMERLGFDWERLHDHNSELVYCSITGYGDEGPYRDWPAMDTTVQAAAGWTDQIGAGDRPESMDVFAIDHATALYAVISILMAVVERASTSQGQRVDVAMFDAAISFLGHHLAEYSASRNNPDFEPTHSGHFAPSDVFEVADGYLALYVPQEAWAEFCEAIDRDEFAADGHRFASGSGRLEHQIELREELEEVLRERTGQEWIEYFDDEVRRVVCSPVNTIQDIPNDPQVEARDLLVTRDHPELGSYTVPNSPLRFSRSDVEIDGVPAVGEHTDVILDALGYAPETIERFRERDVIR